MLISCSMTTDFSAWLQNELDERDLSPADLARLTRKDPGIFSRILGRKRNPDPETLNAISKALRIPPEQVFRAAGLLPAVRDLDEDAERIVYESQDLTPQEKEEVLAFIHLKKNLRKKK